MNNEQLTMKTEWVHKKLGDLGYSYSGLSGKTIDDFGEGKPFIPYMNIFSNGEIDPNKLEYVRIADNEHQNKVEQGDWFFTTSSETPEEVGMTSVLVDNIGEAYLNSFCFGFRLYNKQEFDPKFASYLFRSEELRKKISLFAQGSTRYNLPKQQMFEKLFISYPESLSTQRRIAAILSSADKVIDSTRRLIEKYKKMKQGMMEDLLKPKEGWKKVRLGEVCERITDGSHDSPKAIEDGYYMPSVKDMSYNCFDFSSCKQISENDYLRLKSSGCKPDIGDVLIAKDGSILKYCFVVEEDLPIVILSSIAILKPKRATIDSHYLAYYFQKRDVVNEVVENHKSGTGVPRIVLRNFEKIEITYPDTLQEQRRIAKILSGIDKKIEAEQAVLDKYSLVKKGLMEKLLNDK